MPELAWVAAVGSGLKDFIKALTEEFRNGLLFFSSPWDVFVSFLDIAVTTLALYYILRLISETRAWQLLKGLIWLFLFMLVSGWLGLSTISYVLVNSVSVLALGLVVIFQPELRRALESVGRNSSILFTARDEESSEGRLVHNIIESIVMACEAMSEEYTGALIIIERQTKLGDLIESGTAVILDAELTSAALRQIFYKNSPMHDGAVLIRGGRIYASRIHVPLSDSYQLRREMGTRHRAAIGVSEIGDAIAVVCSEERGTISIAVHGRLYTLENADALRTVLHRLLGVRETKGEQSLPRRLRKVLRFDRTQNMAEQQKKEEQEHSEEMKKTLRSIEADREDMTSDVDSIEVTAKPRKNRFMLMTIALLTSLGLWLYVRVTTNPVTTKFFTVPINTTGLDVLDNNHLDYFQADKQVQVQIRGRKKVLDEVNQGQVNAYIDFSKISEAGVYTLPVQIDLEHVSNLSYAVVMRSPDSVSVNVYQSQAESIDENAAAVTP